jgi:hypothetical protein
MWSPPGVHLESTWSPSGVHQDCIWSLPGVQTQYQEFTWTPDGVHQDPWGSVTYSKDVESTDENAGDMEDQADAYEQLRLEHETDRPVCREIRIVLAIANISFSGQKKAQFSWQ